jgi:glucose-1-phosphate thymidylyltransferase
MKALILAAGYATRLYPLTKDYPKPLLLIGERPIIDYIVDKINEVPEIDEIIVVTNSKFIVNFRKWAGQVKSQVKITLLDDQTHDKNDRRGAIGDMSFSIETQQIRDDLLVIGGDNLFDGSLRDFLGYVSVKKDHPIIGAYDIKEKEHAQKYGVVKIDGDQRIVDFKEKPEHPESTLVAMCLYYLPRNKLSLIREYMASKSTQHDATGFYIDWLRRKEDVYVYVFQGRWFDIGHMGFYNEAKDAFS